MLRPKPNSIFCQSPKMTLKEKSTLLTMQGWTSPREDYGIPTLGEKTFFDIRITHPTSVLF